MPIETNLNSSPYFDDYSEAKEYYKILFKPGVSVQTRELNQLQTILQNQVERFGNHVFKSGTIISGCNFEYLTNYNYIKITDLQGDGQPVQPSSYVDYFIKDSLNLTARIVNFEDGFQSKAPDLATLYVQYVNSSNNDGNGVSWSVFRNDQSLTIFDKNYPLFSVGVTSGGLGFSNSDTVVVLPAIVASGNSGSWQVNERLTQATTGAQVQIVSVNTTVVPTKIIISVKPLTTQLTNNSVNATAWTFSAGFNITGNVSAATANVTEIVGTGASATVVTDSLGIAGTVAITNQGNGYFFTPYVTVKTTNTTASVATLSLAGQNYKAVVTVANAGVNAIGSGYGFGVSEGLIYQKGYFLKVDPQVTIVSKYSTVPDSLCTGFTTDESIIDTNADTTLFDNAANTTNFSAPGADRLQLTPTLEVFSSTDAAANVDFFTLAEWKNGFPWRENRTTAYSTLGEEFARRTRESEGNYVVDPFTITTKDKASLDIDSFDTVIDPGLAYISGYRIQTQYNSYIDTPRSNTTTTQTNQAITTNYGNYVVVKELAGMFSFKSGPQISLYDTAQAFISKYSGANTTITPAGNAIGTARIRSLVLNAGTPGTPGATYKAYLFEIVMTQGKSFRDVRAIHYASGTKGLADIVTSLDGTTNNQVASLVDTGFNQIVYSVGQPAVQSISNINFQYRTISDPTLQFSVTGQLDIGPLSAGLTFPYTAGGSLTTTQKQDIVVFPVATAIATANLTGTFAITSGSANITGTSTLFTTEIKVGDFIKVGNTTQNSTGLVAGIVNNTFLQLNNTASTSVASGNGVQVFPANHPVPLSLRTVSLSGGGNVLTIQLGVNITGITNAVAIYNVRSANASPVAKTINRNIFVKVHTANNAGGNTGPWSLGLPDISRLRNVYQGNSTVVNTSSTDITKYFYVDNGGDENLNRLGRLVLNSGAGTLVSLANSFLLIKCDAYTTSGTEGFFTLGSYSVNDTLPLANLTTSVNTLEIPELITSKGDYYDLRDSLDFRPFATNTALVTNAFASATINPANTLALSASDKFFPVPDVLLTFDVVNYNWRQDLVVARIDNTFENITGVPVLSSSPPSPAFRPDSITLGNIIVPPYPSLPISLSNTTVQFLNKQVGNYGGVTSMRQAFFQTKLTANTITSSTQPRRYSMDDIGKLDRRLQTLEYYTSFNLLESQIKDLIIPSGVDPSINRFKHGFFVDSFDDYGYADTNNIEYAATIEQANSVLKPYAKQVNFLPMFDRSDSTTNTAVVQNTCLMLPFNEETLINQNIVTSAIGGDGQKVQFGGEVIITPASFTIKTRHEVAVVPPYTPTIVYSAAYDRGGVHYYAVVPGYSGVGYTIAGIPGNYIPGYGGASIYDNVRSVTGAFR